MPAGRGCADRTLNRPQRRPGSGTKSCANSSTKTCSTTRLSRIRLSGFDACFFCIGVSSAGLTEERYRHVTYDIPMAVAQTLIRLNPDMTFVYVSGIGTDSTERGRIMWARVKGSTENALLRLPFKAAVMIRPAVIVPLHHGIKSRTALYRLCCCVPCFPW